MSKNKIKQEKAITLIALVVSIIVLLILAGVSIAVLTGENGILNRATEAKQTHEEKTEEEKLKLGVLALSTEYRSKTTHTADEDKFSKFVNKQANKNKIAEELGVSSSAIEIDEADDILTYREKQYKLDSYGGIADYTPPEKVTLTLVKDEDNDGKKSIGDEVKVGEEHFYILKKDGTTMTLLSKYNLKKPPTDSTPDTLQQYNGNHGETAMRFSQNRYWSTQWNNNLENKRINLNNWETNYNSGNVYSGETTANNAILRARKYATDVFGENAGAKGRLLTYEEAKTGLNTCLFGTGANQTSTTILNGQYTGDDKVGTDGCLYSWLASSNEYEIDLVCIVNGIGSFLSGYDYDSSDCCGVRPVIEVPESAIQ